MKTSSSKPTYQSCVGSVGLCQQRQGTRILTQKKPWDEALVPSAGHQKTVVIEAKHISSLDDDDQYDEDEEDDDDDDYDFIIF